jgi:hypothetical protein
MRGLSGCVVGAVRAGAFALAALCLGRADASLAQVVDPGLVIQTISTADWIPASPDPAGITWRPDTGDFLTCDDEVDEMSIFAGVNVWTHSSAGVVSGTASTLGFGNEPTGIAFDPAGGRLWISDDNAEVIYQVALGGDGVFGTADDGVFDIDGLIQAGCDDLEDVTYDNVNDRLFALSRIGLEICEITPGPNGTFDDAPPLGDDVVTVASLDANEFDRPRGIVYDPFWNTLVIADRGTGHLHEVTPGGVLLRRIDVNFPAGVRLSGVTIAPGSTNPVLRNYWVVESGVDNGVNPLENDGRLFEIVAVPLGGNGAPAVDAGPPQTLQWPANGANLDGFVSDDAHPYPPSTVTATWSLQSGPGGVTFDDANDPDTSATFSAPGSYVLELTADDSELSASDTVEITLTATFTLSVSETGAGTVTADPPGPTYPAGTAVTLTATPNAGWVFTSWSGDVGSTANPLVVTMDGDLNLVAQFSQAPVSGCGIGPELVALIPALGWLFRRRRASH